jgi:Nucleotidyltransferase domain
MKDYRGETVTIVRDELSRQGISWDDVCSSASQIILYGSTACGLSTSQSDIDLLCIGSGERMRSKQLDIKWISRGTLHTRQWLHSELASHIGTFGKWLQGTDDWSSYAQITTRTVDFKRRLISGRLTGLRKRWDLLGPSYRRKHVAKLRRDLQRLYLLTMNIAVPPTPVLDYLWSCVRNKERSLIALAQEDGVPHLVTTKDIEVFGAFALSSFVPSPPRSFITKAEHWTKNYCSMAADVTNLIFNSRLEGRRSVAFASISQN